MQEAITILIALLPVLFFLGVWVGMWLQKQEDKVDTGEREVTWDEIRSWGR